MRPSQKPAAAPGQYFVYSWPVVDYCIKGRHQRSSFGLLQMQVNHGGIQTAMPQQFFDGMDIGTGIQQVCGKRMAQGVCRIILSLQSDHFYITLYPALGGTGCCVHAWVYRLFALQINRLSAWPACKNP